MAQVHSAATHPRIASAHIVASDNAGALLYVPDSGRLFAVDDALRQAVSACARVGDDERSRTLLAGAGLLPLNRPAQPVPRQVPVTTISLAISSRCNLGCTYCYADGGQFGGDQTAMSADVARRAIDRLVADAEPGQTVRVTFLGGEPFANRDGLREATAYARAQSKAAGIGVAFSLTTNATLLTERDCDFLDEHDFAVTVSMDGIGPTHDRLRPFKNQRGSYARIVERLAPWLARPGRRAHVAARVSVTPANLELRRTLTGLIALGFGSVQFSPVLSAPTGRGEMDGQALHAMLEQMIDCGRLFEEQVAAGAWFPFANMISSLQRIYRQLPDEYPCGAGGSYVGVGGDGGLFACHRFVGDDTARLGDVETGVGREAQAAWLATRNLRYQEPCNTCWARHLCGGGCHYEVVHRGRNACGYIRGWLDYCLGAYARLHDDNGERFLARLDGLAR